MNKLISFGFRAVFTCIVAGAVALWTGAANAFTELFPANTACEFPLLADIDQSDSHTKEITFNNGRIFVFGTGPALTFINVDTGASLSLKGNGFTNSITTAPDGTQTWVLTGHNVVSFFPTDNPHGPSTVLYIGRIVFTVDTAGNFNLQGVPTGNNQLDICAALS